MNESMLNLACVVGARPNFVKVAPILRALNAFDHVRTTLVHTGQHYDPNLSDIFFEELGVRRPDIHLEVGSGKHGAQTARLLERMEEVLAAGPIGGGNYDRLGGGGDVNSTMAATLAAAKLGISVAHVEAGLRSFDRTMPEEINRIVTDSIADMLLVTENAGMVNLRNEGHADDSVHLVGNVMIDTLLSNLSKARSRDTLERFHVRAGKYGVLTLHRPSNVDDKHVLEKLLDVLLDASKKMPLVFPIHPRTLARFEEYGFAERLSDAEGVIQLPPLGYLDFLALTSQSQCIITDSGGLQEESTALGIPCLTMRENTERPITVDQGTSTLIGNDYQLLRKLLDDVLHQRYKQGTHPTLWDGKASERIAQLLVDFNHRATSTRD